LTDKIPNINIPNKANALTVFFCRIGKSKICCENTDFLFVEIAKWKQRMLKLFCRKSLQEIALARIPDCEL